MLNQLLAAAAESEMEQRSVCSETALTLLIIKLNASQILLPAAFWNDMCAHKSALPLHSSGECEDPLWKFEQCPNLVIGFAVLSSRKESMQRHLRWWWWWWWWWWRRCCLVVVVLGGGGGWWWW